MRTLTAAFITMIVSLALAAAAQAKGGPITIEVSGPGLDAPVTLPGEHEGELVFANDGLSVTAPVEAEPAYEITLTEQTEGATVGLTYFPGVDGEAGTLIGDWEGAYHFRATAEFESMMDSTVASASAGDGNTSLAWYLLPAAGAGIVLAGGLAGRRLLQRRPD